jgi:hypothetical protein
MYSAIVTKIKTRPHPNADRLLLGLCHGYQVVVGLNTQDGDLGVFFASDGQLSQEMCDANDLVGYNDTETGEKKGGFFPANRRVRAQSFRGEKSEGYWTPLSSLAFTGADLSKLKEGDSFTELNGVPICNKYFTPATLRAQRTRSNTRSNTQFAKHIETLKFKNEVQSLPINTVVYITEKLHGTSGRFGYVLDDVEEPQTRLQRLLRRPKRTSSAYTHMVGTRNTILADHTVEGFYGSEEFRWNAIRDLVGNLHKGEILYFELVGYTTTGSLIMGAQNTNELKKIHKKYGPEMTYTYGQTEGTCGLYVYRITHTTPDGAVVELSWPKVKERCNRLGIKHVPEFHYGLFENPSLVVDVDNFADLVDSVQEGPSLLSPAHISEGVVVRAELPSGEIKWLKAKSFTFGLLEGYLKSQDDYVDTEEVS